MNKDNGNNNAQYCQQYLYLHRLYQEYMFERNGDQNPEHHVSSTYSNSNNTVKSY